jgi:tetratricopeptide (TPR) repeat protein
MNTLSKTLNVNTTLTRAKSHAKKGQLKEAWQLYQSVLEAFPQNQQAKKGLKALQKGQVNIKNPSGPPQVQLDSLIALYSQGQIQETLSASETLIKDYPNALLLYNTSGVCYQALGQLDAAVKRYEQALAIKPDYAEAHYNLGNTLKELGQLEAASNSYERALTIKPDYAEAHYNLGNTFQKLGQLDAGVKSYEKALAIKPDYAEAHNNLGLTLHELGQLEVAVKCYEQALAIKPDYTEVYINLGVTLKELGQLDAGVKSYEKALAIKPDSAEAHYNFGNTLKELGQLEAAVKIYEQALAIKPDYAEAKFNLSLAQLLSGDFQEGWKNYQWRWTQKYFEPERHYPYPRWKGSLLTNKILFVYCEQGVGDEIMFSSCIPDLIAQQPKLLIIECDARIKPLFNRSFPQVIIQVKNKQKDHVYSLENENIDFHVPMGDLPKYLRPNINTFPKTLAFIAPNVELYNKWVNRFNDIGTGIKIGLSWRGGNKATEKKSRSTTLQLWEPLLQSDAHFVNLQYGDCTHEINQLHKATGITIHDWLDADPLKNLDNFAAQIAALDLVITIDNSTAHFAGALGIPTWVLLPLPPDWRWLLDRGDSPWYLTMRLFRQQERGNWTMVFNEVYQALEEYLIKNTRTFSLSAMVLSTSRVFREGDIIEGHARLTELLSLLDSDTVKLSQDQVLALKPFLHEALTCLKNKDYSSLAYILEIKINPLLILPQTGIGGE